ncbi:unnamed protein product [Larinioides sclopetarius]|uniref:C2H2-type domain-containing protein n=1 Tax=Larinioides sclopetarius TaxID=280406 RepID=A0AAV2BDD8_9ARAC
MNPNFSDSEEFEWMKDVSDSMLLDGKQLEPSPIPSGFGFIATSGSDSEVSKRLTDVPMPMLVDEPQPGPSRAPMGFGYVETSLTPTNDHVCEVCKKTFTRKDSLKRHMKKHGDHANHACSKCAMKFYRLDKLQEHVKTHEKKKTYSCEQCDGLFSRMSELLHHKRVDHPAPSNHRVRQPRLLARNSRRNALDVFSSDFLTPSPAAKWDFLIFLQEIRQNMHDLLVEELQQKRAIKWYCVSKIRFSRETPDGDIEYCTPYFCSKVVIELDTSMIDDHIEQAFEKIKSSFDEFLENGSGWVFDSVIHMELKTATYHPLAPSSYIPLPPNLAAKKALINIKNVDLKCFVWSVLAALHPVETNPQRVSHYSSFEQELRLGNVACPVQPSKVPIIEKLNNLRINVFGYEDEEVFPLYISKREDAFVINLLYISQGDNKHYCLIKNMSRLLGDLTKHDGETFYCYSCLHRFSNETLLKNHVTYCNEHTPQRIVMPEPGEDSVLEFKQFKFSQPVPYVIYADFEALIQPIQGDITKTASHIPCGYAYLIIGPNGLPLKPVTVYRGADAVDHFVKSIVAEKDILAAKLHTITPMHMTTWDLENFQNATHCNLCKKWLGKDRVRDHDHITGKYRQALHNKCNLQLKQRKLIPCIFHNLRNYDGHLIMQGLGKIKDHEINVIPNTKEKYISFSIRRKTDKVATILQFVDSFQFLNTSLQKLVENLDKSKFSIMENCISSPHRGLLLKKGIYPYEYMTSFCKFDETELPPRSAFHSSLTNEGITEEEYEHARNVWKSFNIQNLGDYHDLYVKTDVILLADVFENFRKLTQDFYELDAAHMLTSPGLAWQAALKMTDAKMDLFTDIDKHLFIEKGIRGGVSMISHRHSEANHPQCPNYDSTRNHKFITYLDANNLYGWAMSQPLPVGDFEWVSPDEIPQQEILQHPDDATTGYILEVDLEYPSELHDFHNSYPLAPERINITPDNLSPTALEILSEMNTRPAAKSEKLVPNLCNKKNYVLHYRNLKLYIQLGLKLVKILRILKFRQTPWLKAYINFNTEQRKQAKTTFEKDFFKLLNNAVYGKTMENLRNRIKVDIVQTKKKAEKLVASPAFHSFTIFDENLVAVQRKLTRLCFNRPIQVGFTILELSKVLMYEFHYNIILKKYGDRAKLLFTDTDSLCYELITDDLNKDFEEMKQYFDFSDYPHDHPLYSVENKKKIGFFKDELNGQPCFEFVGLRSKMYSILSGKGEKQTAKGISKTVRQQKDVHLSVTQRGYYRAFKEFNQLAFLMERIHLHHRQCTYELREILANMHPNKCDSSNIKIDDKKFFRVFRLPKRLQLSDE